jgi:isopentenyl-diphosphate Delta-isomerase
MRSVHTQVILVDPQDKPMGLGDKMYIHQQGAQHRAFSVFLYKICPNNSIELLLQKRHQHKYHSGGLWTNTCCSHPLHLESPLQAASRRLHEELNISNVALHCLGKIAYHVKTDTLSENEIDYIFIGPLQQPIESIVVNPVEIEALKWMPFSQLKQALIDMPEHYTKWLPEVMQLLTANQEVFYQCSQKNAIPHE